MKQPNVTRGSGRYRDKSGYHATMAQIRTIDLFSGAGGSSWGARRAGATIVAGFDLWETAGQVYKDNFPEATHFLGRLEAHDMGHLVESLGRIDLILASPECTNHSPAKGSQPRCEKSKETAFQVVRFAKAFSPRWVIVENVVSMRRWHRYGEFLDSLKALGYGLRELRLTASHFGAGTSRRRLFILCDKEGDPPKTVPTSRRTRLLAEDIVDLNGTYRWSPLKTPRRAIATLERARRGIRSLGDDRPFLLVYYGSDHAGGWQALNRPLRTITTVDRFALVKPTATGHAMRMLQVPELKAAMGMPTEFRFERGTRRDRIRMIGNAVCPPVMEAVVRTLIR
jgi:DNA (cytosine-5)-methyltransferase 1